MSVIVPVLHVFLSATLLVCFPFTAECDEVNTLRLALLKYGTAHWEADVIKHHGLDRKYGFDLEIIPLASKQATVVTLHSGSAEMILDDWIWVSRQRNAGHQLVFFPYSRTVGGLVVPHNSEIRSLDDLPGRRLGIAGGPTNRSWLMIQALAKQQFDIDLHSATEIVYGAPPLLHKKMLDGELDGIINYWHYLVKLEIKGMRRLISMDEVVRRLGFNDDIPLLGYVFRQSWAESNPALITAMMAAAADAKQILTSSNTEWERLRPLIKAGDDAEFLALRQGFRVGIPSSLVVTSTREAGMLYNLIAKELRGPLAGSLHTLAEGTFYRPPPGR